MTRAPTSTEGGDEFDEDTAPLNAEREERQIIMKARAFAKKKHPNHPDRVALEEFLRRKRWSKR